MIHVKKISEIQSVPNKVHTFVNGDGWDVYQKGDDVPVITQEPFFPVLSAVQIRLALDAAGLLNAVESAVESAGSAAQIWWKKSQDFARFHPILLQMIAALGWSDEQVNQLWTVAASL